MDNRSYFLGEQKPLYQVEKRLEGLGASLPKSTIKKALVSGWCVTGYGPDDYCLLGCWQEAGWSMTDICSFPAERRRNWPKCSFYQLIRMFLIPWKCEWPVVLLLLRISQAFLNPVNAEELVNVMQSACSVWRLSKSSHCTDVSPSSLQNCWNGL